MQKENTENIEELNSLIKRLSENHCIGNINTLTTIIKEYLPNITFKNINHNIFAEIKGETDSSLIIDAHMDEIGFIVTEICGEFLKVAFLGGIDKRTLATKKVVVFGKKNVKGVFCSTPPHLNTGEGALDYFIDTGNKNVADYVSVGDFAAFLEPFNTLNNNFVCGKSLDNRAGVASILYAVKHAKKLKYNTFIQLSNQEELGLKGAKNMGFLNPCEKAIVVDVSFGNQNNIEDHVLAKLSSGAMIGVSPILNKDLKDELLKIANKNNISYTLEIMNGQTGTNADVLAVTKGGIKTALISIPLRNMHTCTEVVCLNDVLSVSNIIKNYIEG